MTHLTKGEIIMNKLVRYDPFAELSALQKHSLGND